jgi:hypothetical protein
LPVIRELSKTIVRAPTDIFRCADLRGAAVHGNVLPSELFGDARERKSFPLHGEVECRLRRDK